MLDDGPDAVQEKVTWGGLLSGIVSMILRSERYCQLDYLRLHV